MAKIAIVLGSESDKEFSKVATDFLEEKGVDYDLRVYSAHRNLDGLLSYLKTLQDTKVVIAVAGLAAALPGVIASQVKVPVIGVPRDVGPLNGMDALFSMLQMPKGVPVATMAIGKAGMLNAAIFALKILEVAE